jgi:hypothetical protein
MANAAQPVRICGMSQPTMRLNRSLFVLACTAFATSLSGCVSETGWRSFNPTEAQALVLRDVPVGTRVEQASSIATTKGFACNITKYNAIPALFCVARGRPVSLRLIGYYNYCVIFFTNNGLVTSVEANNVAFGL